MSNLYFKLAGQVTLNWNPLICSLVLMVEKLDALGFTYYNEEVLYSEAEEDGNV